MQEDLDTCRICSAPAEPEQPLFHPCKCSGTIRYIHQDCLTTWLAHSKKKTCDVCKHQYSFTKVYSPNMPKQLPVILFLRRLVQQILWSCLLGLRAMMVATIWLAVLPYVTVWTWRFYFLAGHHIAWWINDLPPPLSTPVFPGFHTNATALTESNVTSNLAGSSLYDLASSYPVWLALSSDIFTGQIIASLIVLAFLGIFLLREWIVQNARPGVFEDNEVLPAHEQDNHGQPQLQIQEQQQPQEAANVAVAVATGMPPHAPAEVPGHPRNLPTFQPESLTGTSHQANGMAANANVLDVIKEESNERPTPTSRSKKGKGLAGRTNADWPESEHEHDDPPRYRRRIHTNEDHGVTNGHGHAYKPGTSRRAFPSHFATNSRGRPRGVQYVSQGGGSGSSGSSSSPDSAASLRGTTSNFQFTFQVKSDPSQSPESSRTPSQPLPTPFSFDAPLDSEKLFNYKVSTTLPYPLKATPQLDLASSSSSYSNLRRPPLPTSALPNVTDRPFYIPDIPTASIGPSSQIMLSKISETNATQSQSPGLASYRAPEDLETHTGPSKRKDYFDNESGTPNGTLSDTDINRELDRELDHYFPEADDEMDIGTPGERALTTPDSDEDDEWEDLPELIEDEEPGREAGAEGPHRVDGDQRDEDPAPVPDVNEDPDVGVDDDMDGALEEAIGMRGPITAVFQNAALMIFALDTTIGLGVWLPFTIGKTSALLSLEPHRILQIIHFPIRIIRLVTDPVVDSFFFVIQRVVLPVTLRLCRAVAALVLHAIGIVIQAFTSKPPLFLDQISDLISTPVNTTFGQWDKLTNLLTYVFEHNPSQKGYLDKFLIYIEPTIMKYAEPQFAAIGKQVRMTYSAMKETWIHLANGDTTIDRIFAIALGYTVVGILVALYLNVLNVGNVQTAGRAVRNAIRQQIIVVKVAAFIVIELVVFPLGCGVMLDLCTLQLFPDTSIRSRTTFLVYAPLTSAFYHWMIGTMFMYQFAILLASCRSIMRPGAMWFIKDPQDQNFHPIRDILDRPTMLQLRKLAVSAAMYSIVVACGMGSIIAFFQLWGKGLMPLRWKMREPLSEIPIDLLFLHTVLPPSIHYFRPRKVISSLTTQYWKWAARHLRLTSYMFGDRHLAEERSTGSWSWTSLFNSNAEEVIDGSAEFDGGFRRVPSGDNVSLPKEMRATVAVDEHGEPLTEAGQQLIAAQNAEAEKAKRNVKDDYTVVYIPPHFRQRVIFFIVMLWLVGSMVFVAGIAIPIRLGRGVFNLFMNREVHDGYSFIVGFYLLWGCLVVGKTLDRMDKRRQRSSGNEPRAEWPLFLVKRCLLWLTKISWMLFWMGVVIPTLIAIVMEVYVVLPLRLLLAPDINVKIHVVESWAIGLIYAKMAISTVRLRPQGRFDVAITRIKQNGWRRPDAVTATQDIIVPVTGGLLAMLLLPLAIVWGLQRFLPLPIDDKFLCQSSPSPSVSEMLRLLNDICPPRAVLYVYPGIFAAAAFARMCSAVVALCASWAQSIRDSEFLLEMRLRNLEPPVEVPIAPDPALLIAE